MATLQHTDELYHILEDEICALKILPGEALSENQLCKAVRRFPHSYPQRFAAAGAEPLCADHSLQGHHRYRHRHRRGGPAHLPACCSGGHGVPGFCAELLAHGDPCGRTPL